MGTHPIFESDFDCLTEWQSRKLKNGGRRCRQRAKNGKRKGNQGKVQQREKLRKVQRPRPVIRKSDLRGKEKPPVTSKENTFRASPSCPEKCRRQVRAPRARSTRIPRKRSKKRRKLKTSNFRRSAKRIFWTQTISVSAKFRKSSRRRFRPSKTS